MNTPRVVMQDTKKAFRAIDKRKDIEAAVAALSNLKGVGPAMASGNHHLAKLTNVAREENVLTKPPPLLTSSALSLGTIKELFISLSLHLCDGDGCFIAAR